MPSCPLTVRVTPLTWGHVPLQSRLGWAARAGGWGAPPGQGVDPARLHLRARPRHTEQNAHTVPLCRLKKADVCLVCPGTLGCPAVNHRLQMVRCTPFEPGSGLAQCASAPLSPSAHARFTPGGPRRRGESSVERASGRRRVPSGLVPSGPRPSPRPSGVRGVARRGERL